MPEAIVSQTVPKTAYDKGRDFYDKLASSEDPKDFKPLEYVQATASQIKILKDLQDQEDARKYLEERMKGFADAALNNADHETARIALKSVSPSGGVLGQDRAQKLWEDVDRKGKESKSADSNIKYSRVIDTNLIEHRKRIDLKIKEFLENQKKDNQLVSVQPTLSKKYRPGRNVTLKRSA